MEDELKAQPFESSEPKSSWFKVLLITIIFYAVGIVILFITRNPKLFPAVVMIGNFAVPIAYITFFYNHRLLSQITVPRIGLAFIYGGILGVFIASILEPLLISGLNFKSAFIVGFVEEFAKIAGLLAITLHRRHTSEMNGLILGAAAGMGFATLESIGYSFIVFMQSHGNLPMVFSITLVRGLLSPIGHGTWTAILAAVLFRQSRPGDFVFDFRVLFAYLVVVILHGLWDGLPIVVSVLSLPVLSYFISEAGVAVLSISILWWVWDDAKKRMVTDNMLSALDGRE